MKIETERLADTKGEKEVNKFLSDFFYSRIGVLYEIVTDKNQQIKGTDTKISFNNKTISIDEKCQLDSLNQKISTQCLELGSFMKDNRYRNGWIIRENDTEYYLFTWIPICKTNSKYNLTCDSIQVMNAMLVSKKKLEQHLKDSFGADKTSLHLQAVRMLCGERHEQKVNKKGKRVNYLYFEDTDGNQIQKQQARITMSIDIKEKPINLVVFLEEYEKIYEDHFIITRDSIYSNKREEFIWQTQKN